jgi:hypothetical protein
MVDSRSVLQIVSASQSDQYVDLTVSYVRDWESIMKDVVLALNFNADEDDELDLQNVRTTDNRDVELTFADELQADRFLQYVATINEFVDYPQTR